MAIILIYLLSIILIISSVFHKSEVNMFSWIRIYKAKRLNKPKSSMQRRQVQRQTKEHIDKETRTNLTNSNKTKINTNRKSKTDDTKQTNHNIFNSFRVPGMIEEWHPEHFNSSRSTIFLHETYRKLRPKFNCLPEFYDLFCII